MSVVNVEEDYSAREAEQTSTSFSARRRHTVLMSDKADGPLLAGGAAALPKIGDTYPGVILFPCVSKTVRPVGDSHCLFEVRTEYAIPNYSPIPIEDQAYDISWDSSGSVEPIDSDADGNPIVNAADEQFDPPVTEQIDDPIVTISRNELTFDPDLIDNYQGKTNADSFYGAPAGEAKMIRIASTRVKTGPNPADEYWRVTYVIQFRRFHPGIASAKAWHKRILNQGFRAFDFATGDYENIKDKNGDLMLAPSFLTAAGEETDKANANWLEFKTKGSIAFGPLDLLGG